MKHPRSPSRQSGFTVIELIIVMVIIIIGTGIALWALQNRAPHYRLRASTRGFLEMMKVAQSAAIRTNATYRLVRGQNSYSFQYQTPSMPWTTPPDGRLAQTTDLEEGVNFTLTAPPCVGAVTTTCFSPWFRPDGTITPGGGFGLVSGSPPEVLRVNWTIGGSVRVQ